MKTRLELPRRVAAPVILLVGLGTALGRAQPVNDLFANRIAIVGTNTVVTGSNVGATREPAEPYHAGTGGASVWWSWTAPTNGAVTIRTAGSSFDTVLAVYSGSQVSALTELASNDDAPGVSDFSSKVVVNVVSNQTCQIAVDGYDGTSGSVRLQLQFGPPQPPPPAPAWVLPDPYGAMVNSSNYAGKVVILDFWATWCGPCKVEIPDFVFLQNKYRADGLVIVGASVDSTAQAVVTFLATNTPSLNYQVVMANAAIQQAYGGIASIPTTFIIDRQNLIRQQYIGTQSRTTFERQIMPLLYGNTRIECSRNHNDATLCWPAQAQAFTLEATTNLVSPTWSTWPTTPTVVNGTNTVPVPTAGPPRYYRLRMM